MIRVAILSTNIGNYDYFWEGFYTSFERYFIGDAARDYYVFTDREDIAHSDDDNVHVIYQKDLGWPGNTIYRYRMFVSIKEELEKYDYIFFFNSNSVLKKPISAKDMLPREGEKLTAVLQPSYYWSPSYELPYERRRKSKAAIPYLSLKGRYYFCGGIKGGSERLS